jgi:hypothetical protein
MKQNRLKHQALSTLIDNPDPLWTEWINKSVASRQRARVEHEFLNDMDVAPGEHHDRWFNYLWGLGVDEAWLVFWSNTLSSEDFRDVALVAGLATSMAGPKNRKAKKKSK